ncbi:MAG: anthranilate phosphoribosyltransferase [Corynebacterium sp.]|nr:anthranilate phosphoribosyltransferase [Corynebacterium sp.]
MSENLVQDYLTNPAPTVEEATAVFSALARGEYSPVVIAALLATIRTRGATPSDISGAAAAFLEAATPISISTRPIIDCVGTGGDGAHTINISTAASLLAAAGGLKVVKHGNRSISSKSGAADVLEALGIPLDLSPEQAAAEVEKNNFTFLFAPAYHPAFKHVMPVRKELVVPTIFNILGPLLNPARPELQLMGIADPSLGPTIIEALKTLGRSHAVVVHGSGTDEIAVHGETLVWELKDGEISHYSLSPADLGVDTWTLKDLRGGDGAENAQLLKDVFAGGGAPAHRDAIVANAAMLFYLAGSVETLKEGAAKAKEILDSKAVLTWLERN